MNQGKRDFMHTITGLREIIVAKDKEIAELRALLGGDLKELPKIDLGQSVTCEEKQGLTDNALIHHGGDRKPRFGVTNSEFKAMIGSGSVN